MNRRRLVLGLVLTATVPAICVSVSGSTRRRQELRRLFASRTAAIQVGQQSIDQQILPFGESDLWQFVGVDDPRTADESLHALFERQRQRDFGRKELVRSEGWFLARAEVAVCVLLAITA
jgi:hypothetical protein